MDMKAIAEAWAARGFSCDLWTDPAGRRWEDYVHRTDELLLVLEGRVEIEIDGAVCRPAVGEELFIPAGAVHSVRNIGTGASRWLYGYNPKGRNP